MTSDMFLNPGQENSGQSWQVVFPRHPSGSGRGPGDDMDEPQFQYLIVTVRNDEQGREILGVLNDTAPRLGLESLGTIGQRLALAGVPRAEMADELPHRHCLLRIAEGDAVAAFRELVRFECRDLRPRRLEPFLAIEPDSPMRYFSSMPIRIGSNFDLQASGSFHDTYAGILHVDVAHGRGVTGSGATVAVVDSGVERAGIATSFQDLKDLDNDSEIDANGHGTAMTSIIHDVAPDAKVVTIRISDGLPRMWKLIEGVCAASFGHKADIINLSVGLDVDPGSCPQCGLSAMSLSNALQFLLEDVSRKAVGSNGPPLLVAATGNDGSASAFSCPARWDSTVAVGAMNSSGARSSFSNYGTPGHAAFLVMPGGDRDANGFTEWSGRGDDAECAGTSPAASYASAMLALYYSDGDYRSSNRKQFLADVLAKCDSSFTRYDANEHGLGYLPYVRR